MHRVKMFVSFLLLLGLLTSMLCACGEASKPDPDSNVSAENGETENPAVELQPSDKLVLYQSPYCSTEMEYAVGRFKAAYPDVEVEYHEFTGDVMDSNAVAAYGDELRSELASGSGPDLLLETVDVISADFTKAAEGKMFLDLSGLLAEDESLRPEDFVEGALTAGTISGQIFFVPVTYTVSALYTDTAQLQNLGIDMESLRTVQGFSDAVSGLALSDVTKLWAAPYYSFELSSFFPFCAPPPIDYGTHSVEIDEDFADVMAFAKTIYDLYDGYEFTDTVTTSAENGRKVYLGQSLFVVPTDLDDFKALPEESRAMLAFPSISGKTVAQPAYVAAINAASPNSENAYRFLQILLSTGVQSKFYGNPVRLDAIQAAARTYNDNQVPDEAGNIITTFMTEQEIQAYIRFMSTELDWELPLSAGVYSILTEAMEPYLAGEKTLDACTSELKTRLQLYLDE